MNRHSKSLWKQHTNWEKFIRVYSRFAIYKYYSISFHTEFHVLDADGLRNSVVLHSKYNLVQEGMQSIEHYFVPPNLSIDDIPDTIENLYLCGFINYARNELTLSGNPFPLLKSITIGNYGFKNVRNFVIDSLASLESVKIGIICFRKDNKERDDGVCRITNCPNLRQLEIGDRSFEDFKLFELSNLNSLQSIEIGKGCFRSSIIRNCYFWRCFIFSLSFCCIWE